ADVLLVGGSQGLYRLLNPLGLDNTTNPPSPHPLATWTPVPPVPTPASVNVAIPGDNNNLTFTSRLAGADLNGLSVNIIQGGSGPGAGTWAPFPNQLALRAPPDPPANDVIALPNGPNVSAVPPTPAAGGVLPAGRYVYGVSFPDASGTESNLSVPTTPVT